MKIKKYNAKKLNENNENNKNHIMILCKKKWMKIKQILCEKIGEKQ